MLHSCCPLDKPFSRRFYENSYSNFECTQTDALKSKVDNARYNLTRMREFLELFRRNICKNLTDIQVTNSMQQLF
jgi:hypothetical protein